MRDFRQLLQGILVGIAILFTCPRSYSQEIHEATQIHPFNAVVQAGSVPGDLKVLCVKRKWPEKEKDRRERIA